jgi:hypothetical protein
MTTPINSDLGYAAAVAHTHNEMPVCTEPWSPSPQRGRWARGEGGRHSATGCLPLRVRRRSLVLAAKPSLSVTPPHAQPLSRVGERGAECSILSEPPGGARSLLARSQRSAARILVACLWMVFYALTPLGLAQAKKTDKPAEQPGSATPQPSVEAQPQVRKVFAIKHADVDAIAQTLRIFPADVRPNRELRVIGVSTTAAILLAIEDTIRRLDVPAPSPQNVELTVYLLLGSDQEGSVAPELDSVVKQLKTTFSFKGFRAVDTVIVRSRDTRPGHVDGLVRLETESPNPSTYSLSYSGASINSDEKGRSIRLNGLKFKANILAKTQQTEGNVPVGFERNYDAGFGTDVDVREGQKVVVGKAAIGGTNTALILVITAKVLE